MPSLRLECDPSPKMKTAVPFAVLVLTADLTLPKSALLTISVTSKMWQGQSGNAWTVVATAPEETAAASSYSAGSAVSKGSVGVRVGEHVSGCLPNLSPQVVQYLKSGSACGFLSTLHAVSYTHLRAHET